MKFATKQEYIDATETEWANLWVHVETLNESQLTKRVKIKNGPSRSVKDALAHVYSWHVLLVKWVRDGEKGTPDLPAKDFKWSQTRDLNQRLHDEHADADFASVRRKLKLSHGRVSRFVASLTENELLQPGHLNWTGRNAIISYIAPNTVSHYRWAVKKIKAITKQMQ
ncbi:MAG: ClbS/DfsB family four-helix bundle protein [Planctomycetaceae bacterium]